MRGKARQPLSIINKAFDEAAQKSGMSAEELAELCVPTYGLTLEGILNETFGDFTVEAHLSGASLSEWQWRNKEGKTQKSVPAAVKSGFAEEWKALKKSGEEIEKTLAAQRDRLDGMMRFDRAWSLTTWRERYLDHPLMAALCRRLIWHFSEGERRDCGIWEDGKLVNVEGKPLDWLTDHATVRLWHPIGFSPDYVLWWRERLEERRLVQPFKQAHREVYLLTDAEINTRTYSNRFAAHILRQYQFNALCAARGWSFHLQGAWDGGWGDGHATLDLPHVGMQAQFWVSATGDGVSESGIALYLSTDQARFCDAFGEPLPLLEIPALLFSEIMRDVDLFVGVASVAADPNWQDRGTDGRYRDYWQNTSFGELTASAQTRKDVLTRLLPRLKIAKQSRLEGKFLIVQGERRTYKIHLGSGNILMSPHDQYLCIVPDRKPKEDAGIFLPFEGDQTLSVILSKAFMLAEDTKIKDPTILSQIGR